MSVTVEQLGDTENKKRKGLHAKQPEEKEKTT